MPVVINRSDPSGGSKPPDKGSKSAKTAAAKPAAKPAGKGKAAASSSPLEDQRVKIVGLVVIIVVALAAALYFMGVFDHEPAPTVATPNKTIGGPGGNANGATPGTQPGGAGPRGMTPGAPVPDAEGTPSRGNGLPGNNNGIP